MIVFLTRRDPCGRGPRGRGTVLAETTGGPERILGAPDSVDATGSDLVAVFASRLDSQRHIMHHVRQRVQLGFVVPARAVPAWWCVAVGNPIDRDVGTRVSCRVLLH